MGYGFACPGQRLRRARDHQTRAGAADSAIEQEADQAQLRSGEPQEVARYGINVKDVED